MFGVGDKVYYPEFLPNGAFDEIVAGWVTRVDANRTTTDGTSDWFLVRHDGVQSLKREGEVFATEEAAKQYAYLRVRKVAADIYNTVRAFRPRKPKTEETDDKSYPEV